MRSSHLCQPLTGLSRSPYLVLIEPFRVTLTGGFRPSTPDGDSQSLIPIPCQHGNGLLVPVKAIRFLLYWSHYKGAFLRVNHQPPHTGTTSGIPTSLLKTTHKRRTIMVRKSGFLFCLACIALLTIAGCQSFEGSRTSTLDGSGWELYAYRKTKPIVGTTITANFSDGEIRGTAGCNSYSGSYT